jgi:hypothetical protein
MRLAVVLTLLLAAPAQAATVTGGNPLVITDERDEVNTMTVSESAAGVTITDSASDLVDEAEGCSPQGPRTLFCEGTHGAITADLGELTDQLTVTGTFLTLDLAGGAENDALDLGGAIPFANDARFTLSGNDGDDELRGGRADEVFSGGPGADVMDGGAGRSDEADYSDHGEDVVVNLKREGGQGALGEGDSMTGIEDVFGGLGDDSLIGDARNNRLRGNQGRDKLRGGGRGDFLVGDGGDVDEDTLLGGDDVRGGAGNDSIQVAKGSVARGEKGKDNIRGALSRLFGGAGGDYIAGALGTTRCGAGKDTAALGEAPDFIARDCEEISPFTPAQLVISALHLRGPSFAVRLTCGAEPKYCSGRIRIRGRGGKRFSLRAGRSEEVVLPRARGRVRIVVDRIADAGPIRYDTSL